MKLQYLIIILILLGSCSKTKKTPRGLYSQEEMAEIMQDIYVLEFSINELPLPRDSAKMLYEYLENKYFLENNIDTTKYNASFDYYLNNPDQLADIYEILADSLSLEMRLLREDKYSSTDKKEEQESGDELSQ